MKWKSLLLTCSDVLDSIEHALVLGRNAQDHRFADATGHRYCCDVNTIGGKQLFFVLAG